MFFNNCQCCIFKAFLDAIKDINCNVDIPQPLEVSGTLDTNIPQPLEISGNINCQSNLPQPLEVSGNINCISTNSCAEGMSKILSQSNTFTEIVLDTGEQYQKPEDVTVDGSIVSFASQGQKIQTTVCKIEYVVL